MNKVNIITNRFSALYDEDDEDFKVVFPEILRHIKIHPVMCLIKYNIKYLEPHPTSYLIEFYSRYRYKVCRKRRVKFNSLYDYDKRRIDIVCLLKERNNDCIDDNEILLDNEIDSLKNRMIESKHEYNKIYSKVFDFTWESNIKIKEIEDICSTQCLSWLEEHHICKCGECYDCRNNNGIDMCNTNRCQHEYIINNIKENIEYKEEYMSEIHKKYLDLKSKYDREIAKKKGYLSEYEREQDEKWDDYCFYESQRWSEYHRNNKNPPKYIV